MVGMQSKVGIRIIRKGANITLVLDPLPLPKDKDYGFTLRIFILVTNYVQTVASRLQHLQKPSSTPTPRLIYGLYASENDKQL